MAWLAETLGPDQAEWRWERIHRTRPRHPLSVAFPELADLLDPPSVGVGGDGDTPQAAAFACADARDYTLTGASVTRYCFDLSDWDKSGWTIPLGRVRPPWQPHYADQVDGLERAAPLPDALLLGQDRGRRRGPPAPGARLTPGSSVRGRARLPRTRPASRRWP